LARYSPLPLHEVTAALEGLPGWTHADGALRKTFQLPTFRAAIAFIVQIAFEAEATDHHPALRNVHRTVDIVLTSHAASDRVTLLDVGMAAAIDAMARPLTTDG